MRLLILLLLFTTAIANAQSAKELLEIGYRNYELGDYKEAIRYFDQASELKSDDPELFYLRGVCKSQSGRNNEALGDYEIATFTGPGLCRGAL